jgi:hypothetical protein
MKDGGKLEPVGHDRRGDDSKNSGAMRGEGAAEIFE